MYIAICDDEHLYIDKLKSIVESFAEKNKINISINEYDDGEDLLRDGIYYDLIFLDIEMKRSNGISVAEEIRKVNFNVPIVYVTGYSDYWRRAYKVHAFDFILKPFKCEEIFRVLSDFISSTKSSGNKTIELSTEYGVEIQPVSEIYYFILLAKKQVQVTTLHKQYIVKDNLTNIFQTLNDERFFMSHRSCIVNFKYVESIRKNDGILMVNGDWLPLAQKKQKEFFIQLSKQLRK